MQLRPSQQRALDILARHSHGQVIAPTGAGKTIIMIRDLLRRMCDTDQPITAVVVAPRLLLAQQLCSEFLEHIDNANVLHVHTGDTTHCSTTSPAAISMWDSIVDNHKIIFTTYHSLERVRDAHINVDVTYFDEAHNSTRRDFFKSVSTFDTKNYYYFTATPRHKEDVLDTGMNNSSVFGKIICNIPAPELVQQGHILEPTIDIREVDMERQVGPDAAEYDAETLLSILVDLDDRNAQKVLVAAPSTKILWNMLSTTNVIDDLHELGYDILHITSKHGAYVNKTKVDRDTFFNTLQQWGKEADRKFVVFHYSILSEGINVSGLTHTVLLRQLSLIEMAQTVGRVIRIDSRDAADVASGKVPAGCIANYRKSTGFVTVPVYKNHGKKIKNRLIHLVNTIFVEGQPIIEMR